MELAALIAGLNNPAALPGNPATVEVIQTHASVVFLAGEDVYKLKKPVNFGFLDYSTPRRRALMCRREVLLNRRLAPAVYLGVLPVVERDGAIAVGGKGRVIDTVVHMRRLPDDRSLRALVRSGAANESEVQEIARVIARFHQTAARGPAVDRFGAVRVIRRNIEENFEQTASFVGNYLPATAHGRIVDFARAFLREQRGLLERRIADGHICDGHGDLRCDHVYLERGVEVVDCIEFNKRFRYGDAAADLAFLTMDLEAENAPDLARVLVAEYERATGDRFGELLDFYQAYRAYVRAKIAGLLAQEPEVGPGRQYAARLEARRFFLLAGRFSARDRRPTLALVCGVTGTGKTTLASELQAVLPSEHLAADPIRKELAGLRPTDHRYEAKDTGMYQPAMNVLVYERLLALAAASLARGRSVILDATYRRRADRLAARAVAHRLGARFLVLECRTADAIVRARILERQARGDSWSDGRLEIYEAQLQEFEPLTELADAERLLIDTAEPIEAQLDAAVSRLV